jgi:hypothetical protein
MADSNKRPLPTWIPIILSSLTKVIAIVTFIVTVNPWAPVGVVTPTVGVAIVRGIDPTFPGEPKPGEGVGIGPYPSDHLVVPLEWRNDTGSSLSFHQPILILHKLNQNGEDTEDELKFYMINELPDLSSDTLESISRKPMGFSNTVYVQPHSIVKSVALFRVEGWASENLCFRFHQGATYRVEIEYRRVPDTLIWHGNPRTDTLIERLTMPETANWLSPYGEGQSIGWDFYSLQPGGRATSDEPIPEDTRKHYTETQPCL